MIYEVWFHPQRRPAIPPRRLTRTASKGIAHGVYGAHLQILRRVPRRGRLTIIAHPPNKRSYEVRGTRFGAK